MTKSKSEFENFWQKVFYFYANNLSSFYSNFFISCSVFVLQRLISTLSFSENCIFDGVMMTLAILSDK